MAVRVGAQRRDKAAFPDRRVASRDGVDLQDPLDAAAFPARVVRQAVAVRAVQGPPAAVTQAPVVQVVRIAARAQAVQAVVTLAVGMRAAPTAQAPATPARGVVKQEVQEEQAQQVVRELPAQLAPMAAIRRRV